MKLLLSLLVAFYGSFALAAANHEIVDSMTEDGLCSYWGPSVEVPGDSVIAELAEAKLTLIEVGAETILCGVEGTAVAFHQYGLKHVGKAGKKVLCKIGKTITHFLEHFFGPAKDKGCKASKEKPWIESGNDR
ncbi:MAG: hypothetical protein AAF203_06355 [Pseudomonadota bacterium]